MAPCDAKCLRDVLQLDTTTWHGQGAWMHVGHDGTVYVVQQHPGKPSTGRVEIPRHIFAAMVEWYLKRQGQHEAAAG